MHVTELYTMFAHLGGATRNIPTYRIIDGVDETSLLLNGHTCSRRDDSFVYTGPELAALIKGRYKRLLAGAAKGLSGPEFFDLYSDPREAIGRILPNSPAKDMFNPCAPIGGTTWAASAIRAVLSADMRAAS